jgi:hypothetical protein
VFLIEERELENHGLDRQGKLEQLRHKHKHEPELKQFKLHWQTEDRLRKHQKPSARLPQMWWMEKFLARTKKFTDAEKLKLETDELSRREMAMGQAVKPRLPQ